MQATVLWLYPDTNTPGLDGKLESEELNKLIAPHPKHQANNWKVW